ncbi:MAG: hypothetical protein CL695_00465 [Chloroflexi bacterium]|nr:hypothetical protein [Chloroflexota bacterium]
MPSRGHIKKRGHTWMLQVSAGFDSTTGKRQRITRTVRGSKKEAQTELTRLLSEIDRGTAPVVGTQTVSEYLDSWLNNVVSNRNRPRTLDSYRIIVERHLNPQIGSIRLHDLAAVHVQQVLSAARASGLSESTALRIFTSTYRCRAFWYPDAPAHTSR